MDNLRRNLASDIGARGATLARLGRWEEARQSYEEGVRVAAGLDAARREKGDREMTEGLRVALARVAARSTAQR
jgi:hypothetical protein